MTERENWKNCFRRGPVASQIYGRGYIFWDVRVSTRPLLTASYSRIDGLYYEGLAWVRYDMSFRRQAPASGNRNWSEVNSTLYSVCFTGKPQRNLQCELCLAKSHTTNNCPLQGECTDRQLGMPFQRGTATGSGGWRQLPPSGEMCKLWNHNQCRYSRCRHTHLCMRCGGNHPVVVCNLGLCLGDQ